MRREVNKCAAAEFFKNNSTGKLRIIGNTPTVPKPTFEIRSCRN